MNVFEGITHIVFDLDGVLVDSEPLWQIAEQRVFAVHGKIWDDEVARQHTGMRLDEAAKVMVEGYQLPISAAELESAVLTHMYELIAEQLVIMPGANELIQSASEMGVIMAIASSSPYEYIQAIVKHCCWESYIQVMASAYQVSRGKPAPDVYLKAVELLGVKPQQCIAFEDSVNGAKAAYLAGLRTVAIPGHGFSRENFAEITHNIFPSLLDVLPSIKPTESFSSSLEVCYEVLLYLASMMQKLAPGEVLEFMSDDPAAADQIIEWVALRDYQLLKTEALADGRTRFLIRR